MGYNTTVVVLNDALDQIENDPAFGKKLAQAIKRHRGEREDVSAGTHANAASVVETHHADFNVVVTIGSNYGSVLGEVYAGMEMKKRMHHTPEGQLETLKSLAEKMGYTLSRKRKIS